MWDQSNTVPVPLLGAGYGSNIQDISKQYSGILYGLSNGLASVAGSISIYLTGQVGRTGRCSAVVALG